MKRKLGTIIAVLLCAVLTMVSVYADDGKGETPDYPTDYYMLVQTPQGGGDIYAEADPESTKLNDKLIPNGTAIHVQGERNGTDNKEWAYTQYHGMNGYIPTDDLAPATRAEAIKEEYRTFGGQDVNFDVKIQSDGGNVPVYNGPGEKFDEVSGSDGIADGTSVHISQYVTGEDGINWGKSDQGWLNLDRDTDYVSENTPVAENGEAVASTEAAGLTPTPQTTPTPEVTPAEKLTPMPEATPTEAVTPTPEVTPTEDTVPTPEATPTKEVTPEATPTEKVSPASENKENGGTEHTSGKNVKSASGMKNPVIWISGFGIIVIIVLLIYFLKKKK